MNIVNVKENIIREYVAAYNSFNICGMLQHLHHDIKFTHINNGEKSLSVKGINAFQNLAELSRLFFSARQQTITGIITGHNTTEAEINYKGILAVNLPDGRKKDDIIELKGRSVFIFSGGKIIGITDIC